MTDFLSAEALNVTDDERSALIWVLDLLETGKLARAKYITDPDDEREYSVESPMTFNMEVPSKEYDCGAVCCIGGWVSVKLQGVKPDNLGRYFFDTDEADNYVWGVKYRGDGLERLYFPPRTYAYEAITPDQAAVALRSFLSTGEPNWDSVPGMKLSHDE